MDSIASFHKGLACLNGGDIEDALKHFSAAIKLNPKFAEALCARGSARHRNADFNGAIADCTEALMLIPEYHAAFHCRGIARGAIADYKGSIADLDKAIELQHSDSEALFFRGLAKEKIGDLDGALIDYKIALNYDPAYAEAHVGIGAIKEMRQDIDGAIVAYSNAIRVKPKCANAYICMGRAKLAKGEIDRAIADITEGMKYRPDDQSAYILRGYAKKIANDLRGAIEDLTKAIDIDPSSMHAFSHRASTRIKMRDFDGAIADCDEMLKLDKTNAIAYTLRGIANSRRANRDEASRDYAAAIAANPNDATAHYNKGVILFESDNFEGALQLWERAIELDDKLSKEQPHLYLVREKMTHDLSEATLFRLICIYNLVARLQDEHVIYGDASHMHYTNLHVLKSIATGHSFRLYNARGMSDKSEGKEFVARILSFIPQEHKIDMSQFLQDSNLDTYIGSFVSDSDVDFGDDMMWKVFGQHDLTASAGCAFVFDNSVFPNVSHNVSFFRTVSEPYTPFPTPASQYLTNEFVTLQECCLYRVVYEGDVFSKRMELIFSELASILLDLSKSENVVIVRGLVSTILDLCRYLFKGRRYKREGEARIIVWRHPLELHSGVVKSEIRKFPRTYVECPKAFLPMKILLGPEVDDAIAWKEWAESQEVINKKQIEIEIVSD